MPLGATMYRSGAGVGGWPCCLPSARQAMGAMAQAVVDVPNDDAEMAQAPARASLPDFCKGLGQQRGMGGGIIFGTINNEPSYVKNRCGRGSASRYPRLRSANGCT